MKTNFLLALIITLPFYSCKKDDSVSPEVNVVSSDKQIRFSLHHANKFNSDTAIASHFNSPAGLVQFNTGNYPGVDSAVFVVYDIATATNCCGAPDVQDEIKIELYDLTNNVAIANSEIVSDDIPKGSCLSSKNIVASFPKATIDIGIRLIGNADTFTDTGQMYLFLYRK